MKRNLGATALLTAAAVLTLAWPAAAQAPIKVGASISLTGTYAKP